MTSVWTTRLVLHSIAVSVSTGQRWLAEAPALNTEQTGLSSYCQLVLRRDDGDSWSTTRSALQASASSVPTDAERSYYGDIESPLKSVGTDRRRSLHAPRCSETARSGRRGLRRPPAVALWPSTSTATRSVSSDPASARRQPSLLPVTWTAGRHDAGIRAVRMSRRCRPSDQKSVVGCGRSATRCWCPTWRRGAQSDATVTTTTCLWRRPTTGDDRATWCACVATTGGCRPCRSRRIGSCKACRSCERVNVSCGLNCWQNDAHNRWTHNETASRLRQTVTKRGSKLNE